MRSKIRVDLKDNGAPCLKVTQADDHNEQDLADKVLKRFFECLEGESNLLKVTFEDIDSSIIEPLTVSESLDVLQKYYILELSGDNLEKATLAISTLKNLLGK